MQFNKINDFDLKGKTILLRVDLNSEIKNGRIVLGDRIIESAKTIKELQKRKAKIVVLAHQGRKNDKDFSSLKQHASLLKKFVKIKFVDDIIGNKAIKEIKSLKNSEALLLENVRQLNEEMRPSKKNLLVKTLVPVSDIYINDAFSVSHRTQTSIVSFPKFLPSAIGPLMEKEILALEKIKTDNALFILGGAKPEENMLLLDKNRKVIATGIFSILCLMSHGYNFGRQGESLKKGFKNFAELKIKSNNLIFPTDFGVLINGKRKNVFLEEFPVNGFAFDIGKKTIESYKKEIEKAKIIFMKGPAGKYENREFALGTHELLNSVANSRAFTVIGGGHLNSALKKFRIKKSKFSYISLSGGALLTYLAGKKLPGIEALKNNNS